MANPWKVRYRSMQLALVKPIAQGLNALEQQLSHKLFVEKFDQRSDDIFVVTYMKSGTTVVQNMLYHMLESDPKDFQHLYEVSPWLELSIAQGNSIDEFPSPRIIKSHAAYRYFPRKFKGKIIYCIRNGMDVAVSKFFHIKNYYDPNLDWNMFLNEFFSEKDNWFKHLREWLINKHAHNILYINYEDLVSDKTAVMKDIACFLNVNVSEQCYERAMKKSSFEEMKANETKFGEQPENKIYNQFIRKGETDGGQSHFTAEQKEAFVKNCSRYFANLDVPIAGFDWR
jgi:hypothetical protein